MELQSIARVIRIGQTQQVNVVTPYIVNTVDDNHREKHSTKVHKSKVICGDSSVDPLYVSSDTLLRNLNWLENVIQDNFENKL